MRARPVSAADFRGRYAVAYYLAGVVVVAAAYYLPGRIGVELSYLEGAGGALCAPAGRRLAVLFLYGVRLWPGIVIGDLLLGGYSTPLGTGLGQTVGNKPALGVQGGGL